MVHGHLRYGTNFLSCEYSSKEVIENLCLSLVLALKFARAAAEIAYPWLDLQPAV